MEASCYCHSHPKDPPLLEQTNSMELDAALHELGMLSMITDSRTDYLSEKIKKKRSSNSLSSAPLCVVQMNSKFVTKFSLSKNSHTNSCSDEELDGGTPITFEVTPKAVDAIELKPNKREKITRFKETHKRRVSRMKYRPYDPRISRMVTTLDYIPAASVVPDKASPPNVSRQDSGNKSNPSSPVKSQNSLTTSGCSIVRSRSLDDLEINKLEDSKEDCYCCYGRSDIDTVSQRISKLHVS